MGLKNLTSQVEYRGSDGVDHVFEFEPKGQSKVNNKSPHYGSKGGINKKKTDTFDVHSERIGQSGGNSKAVFFKKMAQ